MVYLSAKVVREGVGKVLLPWEIFGCHLEMITIHEFLSTLLLPRLGLFEFADEPEVRPIKHQLCVLNIGLYSSKV